MDQQFVLICVTSLISLYTEMQSFCTSVTPPEFVLASVMVPLPVWKAGGSLIAVPARLEERTDGCVCETSFDKSDGVLVPVNE